VTSKKEIEITGIIPFDIYPDINKEIGSEVINQLISPLCYLNFSFVILCGSVIYILPQRDTKGFTKVTKGF
jgi:hypothetical protein